MFQMIWWVHTNQHQIRMEYAFEVAVAFFLSPHSSSVDMQKQIKVKEKEQNRDYPFRRQACGTLENKSTTKTNQSRWNGRYLGYISFQLKAMNNNSNQMIQFIIHWELFCIQLKSERKNVRKKAPVLFFGIYNIH